jgi:hypothetical protein
MLLGNILGRRTLYYGFYLRFDMKALKIIVLHDAYKLSQCDHVIQHDNLFFWFPDINAFDLFVKIKDINVELILERKQRSTHLS